MKALPLLLLAALLAAQPCRAQSDARVTPPSQVPNPIPRDPAVPPLETPSAMQPEPVTPLVPRAGSAPDAALDLVPAKPGQLNPEPTLTPDVPPSDVSPAGSGSPAVGKNPSKRNRTEVAEQDLAERIHYRQARTRALADPAVQQEWNRSVLAHTDLERRQALTQYYKLLFSRVMKLDPSLKKMAQLKQAYALMRLTQSRVAPTEPRDAAESSRTGVLTAAPLQYDF